MSAQTFTHVRSPRRGGQRHAQLGVVTIICAKSEQNARRNPKFGGSLSTELGIAAIIRAGFPRNAGHYAKLGNRGDCELGITSSIAAPNRAQCWTKSQVGRRIHQDVMRSRPCRGCGSSPRKRRTRRNGGCSARARTPCGTKSQDRSAHRRRPWARRTAARRASRC